LSPGEIVGQILSLQKDRSCEEKRLNVVIMGMGEPLHNYDNVMKALRLMTDPNGMSISPRRITLSTSGVVPAIERLAREPIIPNRPSELKATIHDGRDVLIPINQRGTRAALPQACRISPRERPPKIAFEYVFNDGENASPADARRLVDLLAGFR